MVDSKFEIKRKTINVLKTARLELINEGVDPETLLDEPEVEETTNGLRVTFFHPPPLKPKRKADRPIDNASVE